MSITFSFDANALDSAPRIRIDSQAETLLRGLRHDDPRKIGEVMWMLYQGTGNMQYLDEAVEATRRAVELMSDSEPGDSELLGSFGERLGMRFDQTGSMSDLDESIVVSHRAVTLTSDGDPVQPIWLHRMGASLYQRHGLNGSLEDLDLAVQTFRRAAESTVDKQLFLKPAHLHNYALALESRFKITDDLEDIAAAVEAHRCALDLTASDHPERPERIANLGQSLYLRHKRTEELDDLESSLATLQLAVDVTPDEHPSKPSWLGALGDMYSARFERRDNIADINECLLVRSRAAELTPSGHIKLPERISLLGNVYTDRYRRTGEVSDIETSVRVHHRAVALLPKGHSDLPLRLVDLGTALMYLFRRTGVLKDMELGISMHKRAVALFPDAHPTKSLSLSNLGGSLLVRFKQFGDVADIEAAIVAHRRAVALTIEGHLDRALRLNNLGAAFIDRYHALGELDDIESSARAHADAAELMPDSEPDKPVCFNNLGLALHNRFRHTGQRADIENSIVAMHRALALLPDGHTGQVSLYSNLCGCLLDRFAHFGERADLEMAISTMHTTNEKVPRGHPDKPITLKNYGGVLWRRFKEDQTQDHFDAALRCFTDAAHEPTGYPSERFDAAKLCATLLVRYHQFASHDTLLRAYSRILDVLPEIVWMGHDVNRRYLESSRLGELVNAAVATAIVAGALPQAVEWLEMGRSIVWSQVLSLRTPLDELADHDLNLANSFRDVQRQLQQSGVAASGSGSSSEDGSLDGIVLETAADRHRGLVIEYEDLLAQIRARPGFDSFLRPKKLASLLLPPEVDSGPVVFINVHLSRCDALVLAKDGKVTAVALPELSLQRASQLRVLWISYLSKSRVRGRAMGSPQAQRGSSRVAGLLLQRMWVWIVEPVLRALGIVTKPTDADNLPHLTWCATGPIAQLPLHAAGLYDKESGPRAFDLVVSSYTPSLSILRHCYERAAQQSSVRSPNVLIVTQPDTPGYAPLPETRNEGRILQKTLSGSQISITLFEHEKALVAEVHNAFSRHQWVHLACHGSQQAGDATQSAFALYDGPLSLADLMRTTVDGAEMAFLSACQTATGDEDNPEESVHLAAGMLVAGFRGVVGTMWSIKDADAPVVVEVYYKKLLELHGGSATGKGPGETGAAYALHEATRVLREKVGEENFVNWVPFVHFGV